MHVSYRALKLLADNNDFVSALPAHTARSLHPLDLRVFASLKQAFRKLLLYRTVITERYKQNGIFTFVSYLQKAYHDTVTARTIVGGFRGSGLLYNENCATNLSRMCPNVYFSAEGCENRHLIFTNGPATRRAA